MNERIPYDEQLRKDLDNFRKIMQVELDYITHKYKPHDVDIEVNRENGRHPIVNLSLKFETL